MKKILILLFSLLSGLVSQSQIIDDFSDIISQKENNILRFYLANNFKPAKSECAEYYMECSLDTKTLSFIGQLNVYYIDGTPYITANYSNGLKDGTFTSYYKNGKISFEGQYGQNIRSGIWKHYYENGELRKILDYTGGFPILLEAYNKSGKKTVENGKGRFDDEVVHTFLAGSGKVEGDVVDGVFDGEWKIYIGKTLFAKEKFANMQFVKGTSYSRQGEQSYIDRYFSAYFDGIPFESITLSEPKTRCKGKMSISAITDNDLHEILKSNYGKIDWVKPFTDYWFFAGIKFDADQKITNVRIFTNNNDINKDKLSVFIQKSYMSSNKVSEIRDNRLVLSCAVVSGKLYLSGDPEVPLLKN